LDVLLINNGTSTNIGTPKIKGAYVEAKSLVIREVPKGLLLDIVPKKDVALKKDIELL